MRFTMYMENNEYVIQLGIGKAYWRFSTEKDAKYYFKQWSGHEPVYDAVCDGWH